MNNADRETPSHPPWLSAGVRFMCRGCGDCCRGPDGYVWLTGKEIAAMAAHLGSAVEHFEAVYVRRPEGRTALVNAAGGDCVFLKDNRCAVYQARPRQCRAWPFWFRNLRSPESWQEASRRCPGIHQGPLHGVDSILPWLLGGPEP